MTRARRVIFFNDGAGHLSELLAGLQQADLELHAIVSGNAATRAAAEELGYPAYEDYRRILELDLTQSVGMSLGYGVIRGALLDRLRIVNFHPTELPRLRGGSPWAWIFKLRDEVVTFTAHYIDADIDYGELIARTTAPLDYSRPYSEQQAIQETLAGFMIRVMSNLPESGTPIRDLPGDRSYYPRLRIPPPLWKRSLEEVHRFLDRPRIGVFVGASSDTQALRPLADIACLEVFHAEGDPALVADPDDESELVHLPLGDAWSRLRHPKLAFAHALILDQTAASISFAEACRRAALPLSFVARPPGFHPASARAITGALRQTPGAAELEHTADLRLALVSRLVGVSTLP